ncbi:hypothetical protein HN419_02700 [Candidatus Woesearchaeota archaeon]|nr:hypothetical protein [Candidatus Woesearchaeota archaeon]MBT3537093.1 hypothetical protein [Candidatus Woesearchaeota archaeon]MBT4697222.1 hypothetical protein [Candidatus Woesearchaeota archaeon]MBT7106597.1 hypothetical protein [Candidatus Woesearchaeota archaeon]MBT7931028.1 hypothetical protein [Candidatus Woesearchaeota archaeon]
MTLETSKLDQSRGLDALVLLALSGKAGHETASREYASDMSAFRRLNTDAIEACSHRQALKLRLGRRYNKFWQKHIMGEIEELVLADEVSGSALKAAREDAINLPTFSRYYHDRLTSKTLRKKGWIAEVATILGESTVLRTFVSAFDDRKRYKAAYKGSQFVARVADSKDKYQSPELDSILDTVSAVRVRQAKGNVLATSFVNARNLHETLTTTDSVEERAQYLRETSDILTALSVVGQAQNGKNRWMETKSHTSLFYDKFYPLVDERLQDEKSRPNKKRIPKSYTDITKFHEFWTTQVCPEETNYMPTHGDALPTNFILTQKDEQRKYSPIDLEYACKDFIQNQFVQLYAKSGILDWNGQSFELGGMPVEDNLLAGNYATFISLMEATGQSTNTTLDEFRDTYQRLKVENYLIWATRHLQIPKVIDVANEAESKETARYYYTLAVEEMKKLGIEDTNNALEYTNKIFGTPYNLESDQAKMREIHGRTHHVLSSFEPEDPYDPHEETAKLARKFRRSNIASRVLVAGGALAVVAGLAAGVIGFDAWYDKYEDKSNAAKLVALYAAEPTVMRASIGPVQDEQISIKALQLADFACSNPQASRSAERKVYFDDCNPEVDRWTIYYASQDPFKGRDIMEIAKNLAGSHEFRDYAIYLPPSLVRAVLSKRFGGDVKDRPIGEGMFRDIRSEAMLDPIAKSIWLNEELFQADSQRIRYRLDSNYGDALIRNYQQLATERSGWLQNTEEYGPENAGEMPGVTLNDHLDYATGKVSRDLIKAIAEINNQHNPYSTSYRGGEMHGYEGLVLIDPHDTTMSFHPHSGHLPKPDRIARPIEKLIEILDEYDIDPNNPLADIDYKPGPGADENATRQNLRLQGALIEYLTSGFVHRDLEEIANTFGVTQEKIFRTSIVHLAAEQIIGKAYLQQYMREN